MGWGDIGKALLGTAPMLARLVPGGGVVVDMVASVLETDANPDAIEAKLAADPQAYIKLQELEKTHERELASLLLEEARMHAADRADARERDVELRKLGQRNLRADILAYSAVQPLNIALGIIVSIVVGVYQFEFGSSKGSKDKSTMMGKGTGI